MFTSQIIGISHKKGVSNSGKSYEFYQFSLGQTPDDGVGIEFIDNVNVNLDKFADLCKRICPDGNLKGFISKKVVVVYKKGTSYLDDFIFYD